MNDRLTSGLLDRLPETPQKVVLVRASRLGDFVCATPAFRSLRRALPTAEIALIAMPFMAELAARSPHLDRFFPFPGFPGMAEQFFEPQKTVEFFQQMQAEQFDLAIQMHGSGVYSNPFTLMLGAKKTAGFVRADEPPGRLDAAVPWPSRESEVRRAIALTRFLGAIPQGEETEFPLWDSDRATAQLLLSGATQPLIGLHPAARETTKRWMPQRFIAVAKELQQRYGGTILVLGGPEERQLGDELVREMGGASLNLAGSTSLPVLGATIAHLAVLITNDSGPAHIAYALSTPSVTIFGGTDPQIWGPPVARRHRAIAHPIPCRPCDLGECPIGYPCLEAVSVQQVVQASEAVMRPEPFAIANSPPR